MWNWLDVLIVALALAQIALVFWIVLIVQRIRNGSVARLRVVVARNITTSQRIMATVQDTGLRVLPPLMATRTALAKLPQSFHPIVFDGAVVTYATLVQQWKTLDRTRMALGVVRPRKAKHRTAALPLAERLGLIPPAWKQIAPLLGHLSTGLQVWREIQRQLPEIQARASNKP